MKEYIWGLLLEQKGIGNPSDKVTIKGRLWWLTSVILGGSQRIESQGQFRQKKKLARSDLKNKLGVAVHTVIPPAWE
jgi:hypothetical protein